MVCRSHLAMQLQRGRVTSSFPALHLRCRLFSEAQNVHFRRVTLQALALLAHLCRELGRACDWNPKLDGCSPAAHIRLWCRARIDDMVGLHVNWLSIVPRTPSLS